MGCAQARQELGVDILLTGDKARLEACAKELNITRELAAMEILPCGETLTMEDEPTSVIREKSDSSMAVGLRALAEGQGDAFASAGNSGALVVGATTIVKRVRGVKRVAFAPIMPKSQGFFMLIDGGANVDCRPEMLAQFGMMGAAYMKNVMALRTPGWAWPTWVPKTTRATSCGRNLWRCCGSAPASSSWAMWRPGTSPLTGRM